MVDQKKPRDFYICKNCHGGKLIHVHSDKQMNDGTAIITFCPVCDGTCMQCFYYSNQRHP